MNPVAGGGVGMEETERPVQFLEPSPSTPCGGYRAMIRGRDVVKLMRIIGYAGKGQPPWEPSLPHSKERYVEEPVQEMGR